MPKHRVLVRSCLSAILLPAMLPALAAEPSQLLLGGAELSAGTAYAYAGRIAPLGGHVLGNGLATRLWIDWSRYQYEKNGRTLEVNSPGAEAALGYQRAREGYWWSAFAGVVYRNSRISPDDPESDVRGSRWRAKFQLEGEQALDSAWKINGIASYVAGQGAYWARARLLHGLPSKHLIGGEAIVQGDPNYRAAQVGLVILGFKINDTVDLGFKIGVRKTEGLASHGYVGIELGRMI